MTVLTNSARSLLAGQELLGRQIVGIAGQQSEYKSHELQHLGSAQWVSLYRPPSVAQHAIPSTQTGTLVYFPKGDQVVINAEGAFIPTSMLGPDAKLLYAIETGQHGRQVVIFSNSNENHHDSAGGAADNHGCERRWLAEHRDAFKGKWVALEGTRLLSSGPNAGEVYQSARSLSANVPYVVYIEENEALPFAGW